jgi:hypothetical protein
MCGSPNIRLLLNKLDDFLEVRRAQQMHVTFLTEAWHDCDSVCLRRLRADSFQVFDRPRPRLHADTLITHHGGIIIVAIPGVTLSMVDLGVKPSTFELLCVPVVFGASSVIAVTMYTGQVLRDHHNSVL